MRIKVDGQSNFFLFQDIVYYFLLTLKRKWELPIENKHETDTCSRYIYESWNEMLQFKLFSKDVTESAIKFIGRLKEWMVTTNIAILTAQKENGTIASFDVDYLRKYKPYFCIELTNNYSNYIVHLDDDIKELFLSAISFYQAFYKMNYELIINELTKYYAIDVDDISEELKIVINHFHQASIEKLLKSFVIMEE